jgi:hypothetical protein
MEERFMAQLNAATRRRLPKSDFGEASQRKYPMPDWRHAANAKSRAQAQYNAGKLSKAERDKIFAKANEVMRRSK